MLRKKNYKDLNKWRETKRKQKNRYYGKTKNAINRNQLWTQEHIDMVMEHTIPDTELSVMIGRSVTSIQVLRSRKKKLKKDDKQKSV